MYSNYYGDIIFIRVEEQPIFPEHSMEPTLWTNSMGIFNTSKQGCVELMFPQQSISNTNETTLHMVEYTSSDRQPLYTLITGRKTLSKMKDIIDFKNSTKEIDSVILSMQSLSAIQDLQHIMNVYGESLGLECTKEATKCVSYVLGDKHEMLEHP